MKTNKLFLTLATGCLLTTATGCDNDDNYLPDNAVVVSFNAKYPEAKRVEWENKKGYLVADFIWETNETEAWFDSDGNWLLTETDIRSDKLPMAIQRAFVASSYATWKVEDVDMLTRPDAATIYVIEVEKGEKEVDLYYAEDGSLLKEVNDSGNADYEPSAIP